MLMKTVLNIWPSRAMDMGFWRIDRPRLNMTEIRFEPTDTELFAFNLYKRKRKIGEMLVRIINGELLVYHTFIASEESGQGYRKLLLEEMLAYSKKAALPVCSMCSYVNDQLNLMSANPPVRFFNGNADSEHRMPVKNPYQIISGAWRSIVNSVRNRYLKTIFTKQ